MVEVVVDAMVFQGPVAFLRRRKLHSKITWRGEYR